MSGFAWRTKVGISGITAVRERWGVARSLLRPEDDADVLCCVSPGQPQLAALVC